MYKAIRRYMRALGYLVTGRMDSARRSLSSNPHVVRATYDHVIEEKKERIAQYKDAVARMIAQQEQKTAQVKSLTDEVNRFEQLKEGAAGKARTVVNQLKSEGVAMQDIKQNEDYLRCMNAYNDFTSTEKEKSDRIDELEQEVDKLGTSISEHKVQLQQLLREVENLKEEAATSVADIITAREEQEIADMVSGISADRSSRELQELRELRQQSKANARVSREVAGSDTKAQEAEFLEYARNNTATNEFDKLIGLAQETDTQQTEQTEQSKSEAQGRAEPKLPEG